MTQLKKNIFDIDLNLLRRETYTHAKNQNPQAIDQARYTELVKKIEKDAVHNGLLSDKQISDEIRKLQEAVQYTD